MSNIDRPKGQLLKLTPYKIHSNHGKSLWATINKLSGFKDGDEIYEEKLGEGLILLISKEVYEKTNNKTD